MAELYHECGIAAIYHLLHDDPSDMAPNGDPNQVAGLMPRLLLDIQNRGQLAAGMTSFHPERKQLIRTHKDVGGVNEVFKLGRKEKAEQLMREYNGRAAIGHVRYATCGADDKTYAQPFERSHIQKSKWFSFGFNGQLANYQKLREQIEEQDDFHLARETDTEIIMHLLSQDFSIHGRGDGGHMLLSFRPSPGLPHPAVGCRTTKWKSRRKRKPFPGQLPGILRLKAKRKRTVAGQQPVISGTIPSFDFLEAWC